MYRTDSSFSWVELSICRLLRRRQVELGCM